MKHEAYSYEFSGKVPMRDAEEALSLAVMAAECLHGRVRVRMDASFRMDRVARTCQVEGGTEIGRQIAQIFTGLLTRGFGERAFRVERVERADQVERTDRNSAPGESSVVQAVLQAMGVTR